MRAWIIWLAVAALGALSLGIVGLMRDEPVNAVWLVAAALCSYALAFRFYGRFVARRVLRLDPARATPAVRRDDSLDYVPTNRVVLFGHHFAAIAGAGPLVGPVLAAQMGYLPGTLWLIAGAIFAGGIQDFTVLVLSTRRDGRSLGDMIRGELGPIAGTVGTLGILAIMMILLAVLALIVVKALAGSPWGTATVAATIPIGLVMGLYGRFMRPGRIGEMSALGLVLLLAALVVGRAISQDPGWAPLFTLDGVTLCWLLIGYGFIASVLPVWLLLAPRDYLSTFLKIGVIAGLALGILLVRPELQMLAITRFIDGTGPVFSGNVFPFLFITIACGAVSGFHALISSGTTPKMLANETHALDIGYGAMLMESVVGIMALIAACVIEPGTYFALNSPPAVIGTTPAQAASVITGWGFATDAGSLTQLASDLGEKTILSRTGGAPTLAVGMARILSAVIGGPTLVAFWYHFAILFEALFILTTLDAGTRVCRFMLQDALGTVVPLFRDTGSWFANIVATTLAVSGWGFFLYQGVTDPLGGINSLWPLFGIANQMLAAMALTLVSVVLVKRAGWRAACVALVPCGWLMVCTLTAGWQKLFDGRPAVGFLAHLAKYAAARADGRLLAPAKTDFQMGQILFNDRIDAALCALFGVVVIAVLMLGLRTALSGFGARRDDPERAVLEAAE